MEEKFLPDILKLQREIREAKPLPGKRILFIGDRELRNFEALRDYANHHAEIQPGGLIVPGGDTDKDILSTVDGFKDMRSLGTVVPIDEGDGAWGYHFQSVGGTDFSYKHAPYESARLKEEEYRREYCSRLVEMAQSAKPDLIFLSNFKVILHPIFIKAFEGKIINVHPSVLPQLKGFRSEYRADQGEDPEASGYTLHMVDTDLDGGPTLFQQHVPLEPKNPEKEDQLGEKEYNKQREEAHRLKIILAQARWSPDVLALVTSSTPRKIVRDNEAFSAEGRPDFKQTEAYQRHLEKEYGEWKNKSENSNITFPEWQKQQKPYSRVLFDKGNGWQTAEAILGAPRESDKKGPDIVTRYSFKIVGDYQKAQDRFDRLVQLADKIREERGMSDLKTGYVQWSAAKSPHSTAYVELPYSIEKEFRKLIEKEMPDVTLKIETKPTRVMAPRKPFWPGGEAEE